MGKVLLIWSAERACKPYCGQYRHNKNAMQSILSKAWACCFKLFEFAKFCSLATTRESSNDQNSSEYLQCGQCTIVVVIVFPFSRLQSRVLPQEVGFEPTWQREQYYGSHLPSWVWCNNSSLNTATVNVNGRDAMISCDLPCFCNVSNPEFWPYTWSLPFASSCIFATWFTHFLSTFTGSKLCAGMKFQKPH